MSTSILEQTRQYHEDIETAEKVASKLLSERAKRKPKFRPVYDHAIQETLLKIQDASRRVLDLYADKDHLRADEISVLGGVKKLSELDGSAAPTLPPQEGEPLDDGRTVWQNFYDQLKVVKDYHRLHSTPLDGTDPVALQDAPKEVPILAAEAVERCNVSKLFSAEENLGDRVDMEDIFLKYTNLTKLRKHREAEFRASEVARLRKKHAGKRPSDSKATDSCAQQNGEPEKQDLSGAPSSSVEAEIEEEMRHVQFQEIDYIAFLKMFDDFRAIPRYCKYRDEEYARYLESLLSYLQGFFLRVNPLTNHVKLVSHLKTQFDAAWSSKSIPGWDVPTHRMNLYCLPTDRLFTSSAVLSSHMQGQKYKKALAALQSLPVEKQRERTEASELLDRSLAEQEFLIQRFKEILTTVIQRTIEHLQKKQSRTLRELQLEHEDESDDEQQGALALVCPPVEAVESDSDDDNDGEKPVYNPLNLPLGWDGKPIPFWLYKLHGLGIEFKCEICGNYSYWGRRAFERHFQEWRHAFGMRCLKIPNTVHFKEITKIEDAVLLYEQLKKEAEVQTFRADQDVECEDAEGNVMSARAYEDLQRQGLL